MQLIERVEHTGQGSLVAQFAFQGCDRASVIPRGLTDCHTSQ